MAGTGDALECLCYERERKNRAEMRGTEGYRWSLLTQTRGVQKDGPQTALRVFESQHRGEIASTAWQLTVVKRKNSEFGCIEGLHTKSTRDSEVALSWWGTSKCVREGGGCLRNVSLPGHQGHPSRKALVNYHQFYSRLKTALGLQILNIRAQTHVG